MERLKGKLANISEEIDAYYASEIAAIRNSMEDSPERRKLLTALYDERDNKRAYCRIRQRKL